MKERALIAIMVAVVSFGAACSGNDDNDDEPSTSISTTSIEPDGSSTTLVAGVTPDEAIEIAQRAWAAEEPDFDFAATRPTVGEAGETYDVGFVPTEITELGGEPHVVVDRATGEVVETYRTR